MIPAPFYVLRLLAQDPERIFLWLDFMAIDQHARHEVGAHAITAISLPGALDALSNKKLFFLVQLPHLRGAHSTHDGTLPMPQSLLPAAFLQACLLHP
jgi:hypothetical protein